LSSDPNRSVSGELGEGAGIDRDNPLEKDAEQAFDDTVGDKVNGDSALKLKDKRAKPLKLIGEFSQIRCHRCGTAKNQEDKGVFMQINEYIAWYHNEECHSLWIDQYGTTNYKSGAMIDTYGKEI
jgi:hypothetical protein